MADSGDLIVLGITGAAIFGVSWWLGNRLEGIFKGFGSGVGDVVEGGVQAVKDFTGGATGDVERDQPEPSPVVVELVPTSGVTYQLKKVSGAYAISGASYPPQPGVKVTTAAPYPTPAPTTVYTTKPDPEGSYNFSKVTVASEAGMSFREGAKFAAKYGPLPGLQYVPGATQQIRNIWGWFNG